MKAQSLSHYISWYFREVIIINSILQKRKLRQKDRGKPVLIINVHKKNPTKAIRFQSPRACYMA